jgi:hypothetical protein
LTPPAKNVAASGLKENQVMTRTEARGYRMSLLRNCFLVWAMLSDLEATTVAIEGTYK